MTTLAANKPRRRETGHDNYLNGLPMIDDDIIWEGAAVGEKDDTGTFRPLVSGDKFAGFSLGKFDNTIAGHVAGFVSAEVLMEGVIELPVTGVTGITDIGKPVYATDDDAFSLTVGGSLVGRIIRHVSGTKVLVHFQAFYLREAIVVNHDAETVDLATDRSFFVADRPYYIEVIDEVHSVAAGGASKLQITKETTTGAPGAGVDLLTNNANAGFDLAAAANTVQNGAIVATAGVRKMLVGDRLARDNADAIQSTAGVKVVVRLIPL